MLAVISYSFTTIGVLSLTQFSIAKKKKNCFFLCKRGLKKITFFIIPFEYNQIIVHKWLRWHWIYDYLPNSDESNFGRSDAIISFRQQFIIRVSIYFSFWKKKIVEISTLGSCIKLFYFKHCCSYITKWFRFPRGYYRYKLKCLDHKKKRHW